MRKHRPRIFIAFVALASVAALTTATLAVEGKAYGKPLAGTATKISELHANPAEYLGKTVTVEGLVTGVCEKRGCWMTLASDVEFQDIRIKVDDGVIVFPMTAKSKHAVAEGVLSKVEMTLEQTIAYRKHHAEEHGEEFDPASVTEPLVYYQITATGAVIR